MVQRNRRQFLEDSMFATAAAVAASAPGALLAEGPAACRSPNEKLGVAVAGLRGRGGSHIGAFAGRKDTEILYLCDADRKVGEGRVEEVAKRQGGRTPRFEQDIRKVLDDKRVDIVSIATPDHWHALMSIWAIQAGKDLYVESPVSHNVSEGRRVVEAARKYQRICQAGTQCRSNPGMIAAMEFVLRGGLGSVKLARVLCYKERGPIGPGGQYAVPSSVNYDLWLGPAPHSPLARPRFHYDWRWQWAYGNGDLGNQGIHQMDLARWALGAHRLSNTVLSYGGRLGCADAGETANTQIVMHDYGDKSLVFEVRGLKTPPYKGAKVGVIVEGTEGYLVMTSYDRGMAFDRQGRGIRRFLGDGDHFANFLRAVRSRNAKELTADIEEGHLSSALCHLGNVSYRLGELVDVEELSRRLRAFPAADLLEETLERTLEHLRNNNVDVSADRIRLGPALRLDPRSETFLGHPEANEMLARDYRRPYVVPAAGQV